MLRAIFRTWRRLAPIGLLCAVTASCNDLRERIAAAGVHSPAGTDRLPSAVTELGQSLFFDPELSGNRDVACSSCHLPVDHGGDGLDLGRGRGATGAGTERQGGAPLSRNVISPFNRSTADRLLWDGRVERMPDGSIRAPVPLPDGIETVLEAQALLTLLDREQMRGHAGDLDVRGAPNELAAIEDDDPEAVWDAVVARLMAIPAYRDAFARAFPSVPAGEHTIVHVALALAGFETSLWELTDTPFDRYLGSPGAPPSEAALGQGREGAALFFGDAGCARCHNGPLLSDGAFHNIGVPPYGPGEVGGVDEGRFLVTGDPADRFAFKTPPLRNVNLTGPYMHNGTIRSLTEAIEQHLHPERLLDQGHLIGPNGEIIGIDPAIAQQIRATIDSDVRPLRPLSEHDVRLLVFFLVALTSDTEQQIGARPDRVSEPPAVLSGLPAAGSSEMRFPTR